MFRPIVEFFTEPINDVDYMNIGLVWEKDGEQVRAVIGAIQGTLTQDQMKIIAGIAEQACLYVLGLDGDPQPTDEPKEVLTRRQT